MPAYIVHIGTDNLPALLEKHKRITPQKVLDLRLPDSVADTDPDIEVSTLEMEQKEQEFANSLDSQQLPVTHIPQTPQTPPPNAIFNPFIQLPTLPILPRPLSVSIPLTSLPTSPTTTTTSLTVLLTTSPCPVNSFAGENISPFGASPQNPWVTTSSSPSPFTAPPAVGNVRPASGTVDPFHYHGGRPSPCDVHAAPSLGARVGDESLTPTIALSPQLSPISLSVPDSQDQPLADSSSTSVNTTTATTTTSTTLSPNGSSINIGKNRGRKKSDKRARRSSRVKESDSPDKNRASVNLQEDLYTCLARKGIAQHLEKLHALGFEKKADFLELTADDIPQLGEELSLNFVDQIKLRNIILEIHSAYSSS